MATDETKDSTCWQISENLTRLHFEERVPRQRERDEYSMELSAEREKLTKLQAEEDLIFSQLVSEIPTSLSWRELSEAFAQLATNLEPLARVRSQISISEINIGEYERIVAGLELDIARLNALFSETWDAFERNGCGLKYLPLGVPRN